MTGTPVRRTGQRWSGCGQRTARCRARSRRRPAAARSRAVTSHMRRLARCQRTIDVYSRHQCLDPPLDATVRQDQGRRLRLAIESCRWGMCEVSRMYASSRVWPPARTPRRRRRRSYRQPMRCRGGVDLGDRGDQVVAHTDRRAGPGGSSGVAIPGTSISWRRSWARSAALSEDGVPSATRRPLWITARRSTDFSASRTLWVTSSTAQPWAPRATDLLPEKTPAQRIDVVGGLVEDHHSPRGRWPCRSPTRRLTPPDRGVPERLAPLAELRASMSSLVRRTDVPMLPPRIRPASSIASRRRKRVDRHLHLGQVRAQLPGRVGVGDEVEGDRA